MRSSPPSIWKERLATACWRRNEEAPDAARPVVSSAASSHSFRRFPRSPSIRQGGRGRRRLGAGASPLLRLSVGCTETRHTHTQARARHTIHMHVYACREAYLHKQFYTPKHTYTIIFPNVFVCSLLLWSEASRHRIKLIPTTHSTTFSPPPHPPHALRGGMVGPLVGRPGQAWGEGRAL